MIEIILKKITNMGYKKLDKKKATQNAKKMLATENLVPYRYYKTIQVPSHVFEKNSTTRTFIKMMPT